MLRAEKEVVLTDLQERLLNSQSVVFTDYRGLRAKELGPLRHQFREAGVEFHVVKNSLLERALVATGAEWTAELAEALAGPTAVAYTRTDETTLPMKLVHDSGKKHEQLRIKGGFLEASFVSAEEVARLATLPSRNELMAMIAGAVQSPAVGILSLLQIMISNVVSGLQQIAEQKAESGESPS